MAAPKREPLSLEELIAKKKQLEEAENKPKFLSKAEREALAIKRREEEVAQKQKALNEQEELRKKFMSEAKKDGRDRDRDRDGYRDRDRDRSDRRRDRDRRDRSRSPERERDRRDRRERSRSRERDRPRNRDDKERGRSSGGGGESKIEAPQNTEIPLSADDLKAMSKLQAAIKSRYLGGQREKRKRGRRLHERKFVFDWDAGEDTSNDYNNLYQKRHEVQFFGRGSIAGVDVNAQKKQKSEFYQKVLEQRRTDDEKQHEQSRLDSIRQKEKKEEWDCRHWSQKTLDEMQDRDWRIFREDFNIAIKGGRLAKPLRSWSEANLPKEIYDIIMEVGYKWVMYGLWRHNNSDSGATAPATPRD